MSVLREHYYRLGSEVESERIEAATALLKELIAADKSDEYDYALKRLITGLTTSRQSARFGFSLALTELVRELVYKKDYDFTISTYLDKVIEVSQVKSSMKGKEARSVLFGRLFGLQALITSQIIFDSKVASTEILIQFVNALIDLSVTKSWLRETSIFTLCQFITAYLNNDDENLEVIAQILQKVNDAGLNISTEGVAVYLSVPKHLRSELAANIDNPKLNWKNGDPFSKGNLPALATALKDVSALEEEDDEKKKNSKQKGSWSPRVPFVWDLIVSYFVNEDVDVIETEVESKKRKKSSKSGSKKQKVQEIESVSLKEFWKVAVDESLFSEKASHERKYWGFEIFIKFFTGLGGSQISHLFTPNLVRCLVNQSAQSNRLLNKSATKVLSKITEETSRDFVKAPVVLSCLIDKAHGGGWNFDSLSKSKTTDLLTGVIGRLGDREVNATEVESVLELIEDVLFGVFNQGMEENDDKGKKSSTENIQRWALDKLNVLYKSTLHVDTGKKWLDTIFKFLVRNGYFKLKEGQAVSDNVRQIAQDRLNTFLANTLGEKKKDSSYAIYCIKYLQKLEKSSDFELTLELGDELLAIKQEYLDLIADIKDLMRTNSKKKEQLLCFEMLFAMLLIQLHSGDDETVTLLGELRACYENLFVQQKEQFDFEIVLTEVVLSLVSRKTALSKKMSLVVWETFLCSKDENGKVRLTEQSMNLLYDVLTARENKEGQEALFEGEDEFVGEEEEGEEEEDEDIDEDDDDEDDDAIDEDDNKDRGDIDKETSTKLAKALGLPTGVSGEVKFDELSDFEASYESESMDDEQMMAMDDQLSKIFKERRDALVNLSSGNKKKQEANEAKQQMIFFKNRVLDLLESFNRVNPNSHLNLTMIKPILVLISSTNNKELGTKAHKLLKTKISRTKVVPEEVETGSIDKYKNSLLDLLKEIQTRAATQNSNQAHFAACNQSCTLISKNLVTLDSEYMGKIVDVYSATLKEWSSNSKNKIQASLFFDFINWINSKRQNKD